MESRLLEVAMSIEQAFYSICEKAKKTGKHYLVLWIDCPYYGGPEEGGWWGSDTMPVAYQEFDTMQEAENAMDDVLDLATKLTDEARSEYGDGCLKSMQWLDERGLDADYLPEPDGHSNYFVSIIDCLPSASYGSRHYE
jgi:hypothetical protein